MGTRYPGFRLWSSTESVYDESKRSVKASSSPKTTERTSRSALNDLKWIGMETWETWHRKMM